jgi:hypothetical protein
MKWVNGVYGKKYAHLRTKIFEKGFAEGKGLQETGLTPEMVSWLDQAVDAYWHHRCYAILAQVGKSTASNVLSLWNEMLDDMYGYDSERKLEIYPIVLQDNKVSSEAKKWLQNLIK